VASQHPRGDRRASRYTGATPEGCRHHHPGLAPQFDGYVLLQLTDLHISRLFPRPWARAVVDRTNALRASLIVVTGDLIDGSLAARRADIEPLRDLRAADGVYLIPGNHEYFFD
jgi:predicted MPP superfamily phosphohydrolase